MGEIHQGAPTDLVSFLKDDFDLETFIETGTLTGDTAGWASTVFTQVYTVELDDDLFDKATSIHGDRDNIQFIKGKSQEQLPDIVSNVDGVALVWLDAHYSGGNTAGESYECPVLDELEALDRSGETHFILIDDARQFLAPPPKPHNRDHWPSITEVIDAIRAINSQYGIYIHKDVIIAVPPDAVPSVEVYLQENSSEGSGSVNEISEGVSLIAGGLFGLLPIGVLSSVLQTLGLYEPAAKLYHKVSTSVR